MKGRPGTFDEETIIRKGQEIFRTKGYMATSLADLTKGMGIGAGSFYNTFKGGKKELFRRALLQRRMVLNQFRDQVDRSDKPVELIREFFRGLAAADFATHKQGCLIANTISEMAALDQDLEDEAVAILKDVELMFTNAVRKEQQSGSVKNQTDASIIGRYLINLYNGINVTRRMYPDQSELMQFIEMQLQIVS